MRKRVSQKLEPFAGPGTDSGGFGVGTGATGKNEGRAPY